MVNYRSQWVYKAPLCITLRIKTWVVAYLKFIYNFFKNLKATIFSKKSFFAHKKLKNHPQKLLRIHFFILTALSFPNGSNRRIHVPKYGLKNNCIKNWVPNVLNGSKMIWRCRKRQSIRLLDIQIVRKTRTKLFVDEIELDICKRSCTA